MAALTPKVLLQDGDSVRVVVYRATNVTSGDTISVSSQFSRVLVASAIDITRSLAYFAPSVSGTTLTLTETSMANDTVIVTVFGSP